MIILDIMGMKKYKRRLTSKRKSKNHVTAKVANRKLRKKYSIQQRGGGQWKFNTTLVIEKIIKEFEKKEERKQSVMPSNIDRVSGESTAFTENDITLAAGTLDNDYTSKWNLDPHTGKITYLRMDEESGESIWDKVSEGITKLLESCKIEQK